MAKGSLDKSKPVIGRSFSGKLTQVDEALDYVFAFPDIEVKDWEQFVQVTAVNDQVFVVPHHGLSFTENVYAGSNLKITIDSFYDRLSGVTHQSTKPTVLEYDDHRDLSNFEISDGGVVNEKWDTLENVPAVLVGFSEKYITLECLVDESKLLYERRMFPASLLKDIIKMVEGELVLIQIFQRVGELRIKFVNGKGIVRPELFKKTASVKELFQQIPKGKYDQHYKGEPR